MKLTRYTMDKMEEAIDLKAEAYMKLESIITSSPRATITINHIERMIIEWLKSDSENITLVATQIYSMLEDKTK